MAIGLLLALCLSVAPVHAEGFDAQLAEGGARLEAAFAAAKPPAPPALPPSTSKRDARLFAEGWREAVHALKAKECQAFFRSRAGKSPDEALAAMAATEYRFLKLKGGESVGAQTNGPDSVFINTKGLFVTAVDGGIALNGRRYDLRDASRVRAMILLHELGHELGIFGPDYGPKLRGENAQHSLDIIHNCVPGLPVF